MQNFAIYLVILGQSYITIARIKIRVLNHDSYYFKICSWDEKKIVQFIIVEPIHERYKELLRRMPLKPKNNFIDF